MTRLCNDIVEYVGHRGKRGHTGATGPTGAVGPSGPYEYTVSSSRSIIPTGSSMGNDGYYSSILSGNNNGITGCTSCAVVSGNNNGMTACQSSMVSGNTCILVSSFSSFVIGSSIGMSGCTGCVSFGLGNTTIDSSGSFVSGQNNYMSGNNSLIIGSGNTSTGDNSSIISGSGISGPADNTAYSYNLKNYGSRILNTKLVNSNTYTYTSPDHVVILTENTNDYTLTLNVPTLTDINGTQLIFKVVNTGIYTVIINEGNAGSIFIDSTLVTEAEITFQSTSDIDFSTFEFVYHTGSWYLIRSPPGVFSGAAK